jgi:DNA-binding LacI/PurR family transcriptional regulator
MLNGLCMDGKPSLSDIARIAGVAKPTVSIVLNGKGDKGRICRDTQSRIRAVARELGYQKQSTMPVPLPDPVTGTPPKMVGLLLSAASPASSLALIPGRDAIASMKGCRLVVVTLPPDPAAAKARALSLVQEGFVSFICCPTVYAIVAGGGEVAELPVIELLRAEPVVVAVEPVVVETPTPPPVVAAPEPVVQVVGPEPAVIAPEEER